MARPAAVTGPEPSAVRCWFWGMRPGYGVGEGKRAEPGRRPGWVTPHPEVQQSESVCKTETPAGSVSETEAVSLCFASILRHL